MLELDFVVSFHMIINFKCALTPPISFCLMNCLLQYDIYAVCYETLKYSKLTYDE